MKFHPQKHRDTVDPTWKIGIVRSSYYPEEVAALTEGAKTVLLKAGISESGIRVYDAFGSFEIPLIGAVLAEAKAVDALIGLGIIVRGETHHGDLLAREAARGIMDVQVRYRIPFAFEVLYLDSIAHAQERVRGEWNRGMEAARSVLRSLAVIREFQS